MRRNHRPAIVLLILWLGITIYLAPQGVDESDLDEELPEGWLPPAPESYGPIDMSGLPGFRRVTADLYRGAQPSAKGMRALEALGIKTVLNLRHYHSDRRLLEGTSLVYVHIDVKSWTMNFYDVLQFLRVVTDKTRTPVFLHCHDGAGRTGIMCAMYRMVVCGWTRDDAISEMLECNYGNKSIVPRQMHVMEKLSAADLKRELAILSKQ